ncbi:hypothetical protein Bca4012_069069 [Brassica carinata]
MKSATLVVVSCVLMFFVLHNTKVEAEKCAPQLDYIGSGRCDPDPYKASIDCIAETGDECYHRCSCQNNITGGHQCTCFP